MVLHSGRACCLVDSQWSALSSDAVDKGHGLDRADCNTSDPAFRGLHDLLLQTDVVVSIVCVSHFVQTWKHTLETRCAGKHGCHAVLYVGDAWEVSSRSWNFQDVKRALLML